MRLSKVKESEINFSDHSGIGGYDAVQVTEVLDYRLRLKVGGHF